jgi:hypothetical protein
MLFGQAAKVQVGKNVAQQNEPLKPDSLQQFKSVPGAADLGTKVEVGNNDGVENFHHALLL